MLTNGIQKMVKLDQYVNLIQIVILLEPHQKINVLGWLRVTELVFLKIQIKFVETNISVEILFNFQVKLPQSPVRIGLSKLSMKKLILIVHLKELNKRKVIMMMRKSKQMKKTKMKKRKMQMMRMKMEKKRKPMRMKNLKLSKTKKLNVMI